MKYVDEFRDPAKAQALLGEIRQLVDRIGRTRTRPLQIMEVCGGHTHSIFRYGIQQMLPDQVEFVHGPGCPVCVLPMGRVDDCVALAERPEVNFTTFSDAMRVPGSRKSLLKADGADIRMVYSPLDALAIARKNSGREVIFFGRGFETTMPSTAMTVIEARWQALGNFSLFCNHITIIPTIKAILDSPDLRLDGFLGPGHVSMVIGTECYDFIAHVYQKPITVAGFEPLDLLHALWMVIRQIAEGRAEVENQYGRIVPTKGNPDPLFFPGGDIGTLAVAGTVNDLAMSGARPLFLSCGVVLEEGLDVEILRRVVASMKRVANQAGVAIVTGDTKVVERGAADKLFINTAGIGVVPRGVSISAGQARPGDMVIVNGVLGDHGAAILIARNQLALQADIVSDCQPLDGLVAAMLACLPSGASATRCLRDAGRLGDRAERVRPRLQCRHSHPGRRAAAAGGGQGRVRDPGARSAVSGQRGQARGGGGGG